MTSEAMEHVSSQRSRKCAHQGMKAGRVPDIFVFEASGAMRASQRARRLPGRLRGGATPSPPHTAQMGAASAPRAQEKAAAAPLTAVAAWHGEPAEEQQPAKWLCSQLAASAPAKWLCSELDAPVPSTAQVGAAPCAPSTAQLGAAPREKSPPRAQQTAAERRQQREEKQREDANQKEKAETGRRAGIVAAAVAERRAEPSGLTSAGATHIFEASDGPRHSSADRHPPPSTPPDKTMETSAPKLRSQRKAQGPLLRAGEVRGRTETLDSIASSSDSVAICKMTISSLGDVDMVAGLFTAEVTVHLWWFEPSLVERWGEADEQIVQIDPSELQVPAYRWQNLAAVPEPIIAPIAEIGKKFPPGVVHYEERVRVTLRENYELNYFPYDVQLFSICLRINSKYDDKIGRVFAAPGGGHESVSIKPQVRLAEWVLHEPCVDISHDKRGKPRFRTHLVARRRHHFYTTNVIVMNWVLCTLALSSFSFAADELEGRASVVLTLLLTTVAFKFVIADALPKVPYMTIADVFMLVGMGMLGTIVVENAAVAAIHDEYLRDHVDRWLYSAIASAWVLLHVFLAATIWRHIKTVRLSLGSELNEGADHNSSIVRAQAHSIKWPCLWWSESTGSSPQYYDPSPECYARGPAAESPSMAKSRVVASGSSAAYLC